jgi:hypothetical protein
VNFTEGKMIEYERMMREIPGFDHKPIKALKDQCCRQSHYPEGHMHSPNLSTGMIHDEATNATSNPYNGKTL